MPATGTEYQRIEVSRRSAATPSSTASGYIAMRWYQQRSQGGKCATSDR